MELKDICTSLEVSKKLKEAGVEQESLFYWVHVSDVDPNKDGHFCLDIECTGLPDNASERVCPAYTVGELGMILPEGFFTLFDVQADKWVCEYDGYDLNYYHYFGEVRIRASSEAEARGLMLLDLKKRGLLG